MKYRRLLALFLLCGALSACAPTGGPASVQEDPEPTASYQGSDPYTDLGSYTMVIAHAQPEGNPRAVSLEQFAVDVEEATYGHVQVEVIGDSRLGSEREMLEQVMAGAIQGMRGGQYDYSPRLMMFTLPFLTSDRAQIDALLDSDLAKRVCQEAGEATGTVILDLCDAGGYRQFSNDVRPIRRPEDMRGLHMRTNSMATTALIFEALGATVTSIPYADLYMALQTGVVDGQDNPWINTVNMEFYDVQRYFTQVNYQFHPDPFYVNAKWWADLPQQFQDTLRVCATHMGDYNDRLVDEETQAARQTIESSRAMLYIPNEEEMAAFREAMEPVYAQCVQAGYCTEEEIQEMRQIVAQADAA